MRFEVQGGERRNEYLLEAQTGGFTYTAVDLGDRANLAAESDLSGETVVGGDGEIKVGGQNSRDDSQVTGRITDLEPARHIQENILLGEFEARPALQDRQKHIQSPHVESGGGALRRAIDSRADKRLNLKEKRSRAVQHRADGGAAKSGLVHRDEQLGRVGDFAESFAGHLEDSQLGSRAESVLYAAQDSVRTSIVALELKNHIHNVLQNLRTGNVAFLGNMSDQDDRDACLLGEAQKDRGNLLDLGHGSRSGINGLREHCLDGIHNHQVRIDLTGLGNDILYQRLTVDLAVGGVTAQTVGTHLDLTQAFLSSDVQRPE